MAFCTGRPPDASDYLRIAVFQPRRTSLFRNCYRVALFLQVL